MKLAKNAKEIITRTVKQVEEIQLMQAALRSIELFLSGNGQSRAPDFSEAKCELYRREADLWRSMVTWAHVLPTAERVKISRAAAARFMSKKHDIRREMYGEAPGAWATDDDDKMRKMIGEAFGGGK